MEKRSESRRLRENKNKIVLAMKMIKLYHKLSIIMLLSSMKPLTFKKRGNERRKFKLYPIQTHKNTLISSYLLALHKSVSIFYHFKNIINLSDLHRSGEFWIVCILQCLEGLWCLREISVWFCHQFFSPLCENNKIITSMVIKLFKNTKTPIEFPINNKNILNFY